MSLKLNKDMMVAAYEYLAASDPFREWNLPPAEDVVFKIVRTRTMFGWHNTKVIGRGKTRKVTHTIAISAGCVGSTDTLIRTMAHEMIHLCTDHGRMDCRADHGPAFRKLAQAAAEHHGFDPLAL